MEKGLFTKASQKAALVQVQKWLEGQKPWVRLVITLGVKAAFAVADDKYADKLPANLKATSQQFFDAVFVEKDIDKAIILGVDLIPEILELFKKSDDKG